MAPQKIRITLFWSDQAAATQDFREKHSKRQVEWANAFFGRYGMELDVKPDLAGKLADALPYCLVESGGYEADIATFLEIWNRAQAARSSHRAERDELARRLTELREQERDKHAQVAAAVTAVFSLPAGAPGRLAAEAQLNGRLTEYHAIGAQIAPQELKLDRVKKELEAIDRPFLVELEQREFRTVPRLQLGEKLLASKPGSPQANPHIFSDRRLKVLSLRFRAPRGSMRMRKGTQPFGFSLALGEVGFNRLEGKFLWSGPLILINLLAFEAVTLAHEIVHQSGRDHAPPKLRPKEIPDFIRQIQLDFATGKLIVPSIHEYEPVTGSQDGPPDDIINYNSAGKPPDQVKLYPNDEKAMKEAFFVKAPDV
jgi:hypothetical protein